VKNRAVIFIRGEIIQRNGIRYRLYSGLLHRRENIFYEIWRMPVDIHAIEVKFYSDVLWRRAKFASGLNFQNVESTLFGT
jgi:hypothetical protein